MPDASPLAEFLSTRFEQVMSGFQASAVSHAGPPRRGAVERFLRALDELAAATSALSPEEREAPPLPREASILVADGGSLAEQLRNSVGDNVRVVAAEADEDVLRAILEQRPGVVVASGPRARDVVGRVRALQPGIPVIIIAALDAEMPPLLEAFASDPVLVLKAPGSSELAMAVRAVLEYVDAARAPQAAPIASGPVPLGSQQAEPRSFAHLAGLLPRALERAVAFDVGAAVIMRPGTDPLVDVYATSDCSEQTLGLVRERALALYQLIAGGTRDEPGVLLAAPADLPIRSCVYFPLSSEGVVVGLTYLGSFRPHAFSPEDDRVLAALASHASGAYRRLEASLHRLRLSPRQSQVLALIASGLSDKEVASRLGVAHRTVRTHVDRMLREHGLRSRTEAVAAWLRGQQS